MQGRRSSALVPPVQGGADLSKRGPKALPRPPPLDRRRLFVAELTVSSLVTKVLVVSRRLLLTQMYFEVFFVMMLHGS